MPHNPPSPHPQAMNTVHTNMPGGIRSLLYRCTRYGEIIMSSCTFDLHYHSLFHPQTCLRNQSRPHIFLFQHARSGHVASLFPSLQRRRSFLSGPVITKPPNRCQTHSTGRQGVHGLFRSRPAVQTINSLFSNAERGIQLPDM